jgi:ABC-type Na+ transport system ATPase subunit NatA
MSHEENLTSWRQISVSKVKLGLVISLVSAGISLGVYGSGQISRIATLEEMLESRTTAQIDDLSERLDAAEQDISGIQQLRLSDLSTGVKSWTVDDIHNRLMGVELQLESLLEDSE